MVRLGWAVFLGVACLVVSGAATAGPVKQRPPLPLPPGGATSRAAPVRAVRHGHIGGIVPSRKNAGAVPFAGAGSGNLTYHGGPVMHANTTRAIFWIPAGYSVGANYQSTIDGFFQNVADASGAITNVYSVSTEYSDTLGPIAYDSTFNGAYVDTDAYPASGCTDSGLALCLTDAQIQAEIDKVVADQGWAAGVSNEFFLFTPKTVGSCFDAGSTICAYSYYCAYHGSFDSSLGNGTVVYANQPYTASSATPGGCDVGQRPNNSDADPTINVLSHEHNESITDPLLNAWYDAAGFEDGDKCAWTFGTALGATGGSNTSYNEQIGTGKYWLQEEWSNKTVDAVSQSPGTCLQRYAPTVQLAGTGTGTVTSGDHAVSCTSNPCDLTPEVGSSVTLTATPGAGSSFANWSGDCTGGGTCTVDVTASTSVSARFNAPGIPAGWSDSEIAPPDGVDPYPANSSPDYSYFDVAQSGDGTERATTIYHPPATGFCYYDTTDTGGIFLEHKSGSDWVADGTIHAPSLGTDGLKNWLNCGNFGSVTQLSTDGTTLLVSQDMSAFTQPSVHYRCAVLIYKHGDAGWALDGTLYPPGVDAAGSSTWQGCNYFGIGASLSADGTRVAVLSWGSVETFVRGDGGWAEEQVIDVPNGGSGCLASLSPAMLAFAADASRLLVGDPNCDRAVEDAGVVYAFDRSGSNWTLAQTIEPPDPVFQGEFGNQLAIGADGTTAVISGLNSTGRPLASGVAWVYEHDGSGWHQRAKLTPTTSESYSGFTCANVLLGGARILCGAVDTVSYDIRQGSVYVFTRAGSSWASAGTPLRLYAQQGVPSDWLGHSGYYGWRTLSSDASVVTAPIAPHSVPIYGHGLVGYEFDAPALGAAPTLSSFRPTAGVAGKSVKIAGSNFTGAAVVQFNGVDAASFTVDSPTQITATVPAGATSGALSVTTSNGTVVSTGTFTTLAVASFTPRTAGAGATVTITGSGFGNVTAVKFHGKPAASFKATSATQLTARVPSGASNGTISVTSMLGTATSVDSFTYIAPPKITQIAPASATAGQTVTITGANLGDTSAVQFHGFYAGDYQVVSDTEVTATVPADATVGAVKLTTPGGAASSTALFKPLPAITSFDPASGGAGASVGITGTNLTGVSTVTFGGVKGTLKPDSPTHFTAKVPAGGKTGPIRVTTPAGAAASVDTFTFIPAPKIASFTPSAAAGATVTIVGANLQNASAVMFHGVAGSDVSASDDGTQVTVTVPATANVGTISVTTPGGTATSTKAFKPVPAIASVDPASGPKGTLVTITGTNLLGATSVKLHGVSTVFHVASATSITFTVPASATTGTITVTTPGGTATSTDSFTVG